MSVNYHAFQSRGVLFSEYEVVCRQWQEEFTGYDPERIARILDLKTDDSYLYLTYFQNPYRLELSDGILEKWTDETWSRELYFNESMAIYHLLYYTKDIPVVSGKWVPSHTIDGVVSRSPTADPLLIPFNRKYTGKREELKAACVAANGRKVNGGDIAYEFDAIPKVHLQLVLWDV